MKNAMKVTEGNSALIEKVAENRQKTFIGNTLMNSTRKFSVVEERYLALLIAQANMQLRKYKHLAGVRFDVDKAICPAFVRFSPTELLYNSQNFKAARDSCNKMVGKTIEYEVKLKNKVVTRVVALADHVDIVSTFNTSPGACIAVHIPPALWELLLDMSCGYSCIDISYLFRLQHVGSMRLFPILCNIRRGAKKDRLIPSYSIERLRDMFSIKPEEYRDNGAFIAKVIKPAIDEIKNLDAPYYGDYIVERDARNRITGVRFITRLNLDKFETSFSCLLPGAEVFREPKIFELFERKYGWSEIPVQIKNVVSFAQEYIEDDTVLFNLLYEMQPKTRGFDKGEIAGLITLLGAYIYQNYGVAYVAPSKGGNKLPQRRDGQNYTDWQLIKYPNLELNEDEEKRLEALIEAQKRKASSNFTETKAEADRILAESQGNDNSAKVIYELKSLTDREIFESVKAGIIGEDNVESKYDKLSYDKLMFVVGLMMEANMNNTNAFEWEIVQQKLKERFGENTNEVPRVIDYIDDGPMTGPVFNRDPFDFVDTLFDATPPTPKETNVPKIGVSLEDLA